MLNIHCKLWTCSWSGWHSTGFWQNCMLIIFHYTKPSTSYLRVCLAYFFINASCMCCFQFDFCIFWKKCQNIAFYRFTFGKSGLNQVYGEILLCPSSLCTIRLFNPYKWALAEGCVSILCIQTLKQDSKLSLSFICHFYWRY